MNPAAGMAPVFDSFNGLFVPVQPLPILLLAYGLVALCYARGLSRRRRIRDALPALLFFTGLIGFYLFTQTALDTLGRRLFFVHRGQHLVLHHLAPFCIALAAPSGVLAAGTPRWMQRLGAGLVAPRAVQIGYRTLQQPLVGGLLFVGLIVLWLTPAVHHWAMRSAIGYWTMNLSMALEGLALWWFMLDPRPPGSRATTHGLGTRIIVLWTVMPPQIALGAWITLAPVGLYPGYAPAEAFYGIPSSVDQQIGGLLTWIPPAMMSLVGTLIILRFGFDHHHHAQSRSGARHAGPGPVENATSDG